eukprot:303948-Pleurochrysis_carterae.AAC.2
MISKQPRTERDRGHKTNGHGSSHAIDTGHVNSVCTTLLAATVVIQVIGTIRYATGDDRHAVMKTAAVTSAMLMMITAKIV